MSKTKTKEVIIGMLFREVTGNTQIISSKGWKWWPQGRRKWVKSGEFAEFCINSYNSDSLNMYIYIFDNHRINKSLSTVPVVSSVIHEFSIICSYH